MDIQEAIRTRHSVRSYLDKPLPPELKEELEREIAAMERRAHLKGRLVRKYRLPGLIVLVAVPLPGTGAWTGALVAALFDIRLRSALPAILAGVLIAGGIMLAVSCGLLALWF